MLELHKPSTQSADRSRLRKHLIPELGDMCMKDINREVLQAMVARKAKTISARSVKNLVALLAEMWTQAKIDGYTQIDPFVALRLPERGLLNERFLSLDEMRLIIERADEQLRFSIGDLTFADSRVATPLQAADLLAYEAHRYAKKAEGSNDVPMRQEYRRALTRARSKHDFWLFDGPRFKSFADSLEATASTS